MRRDIFNCTKCNLAYALPSRCDHYVDDQKDRISHLKSVIEKMREVNEFYAKPNGSRQKGCKTYTYYLDDFSTNNDAGWILKLLGKRARELELWLKENYDKGVE